MTETCIAQASCPRFDALARHQYLCPRGPVQLDARIQYLLLLGNSVGLLAANEFGKCAFGQFD